MRKFLVIDTHAVTPMHASREVEATDPIAAAVQITDRNADDLMVTPWGHPDVVLVSARVGECFGCVVVAR